jgi:hypothetical protein
MLVVHETTSELEMQDLGVGFFCTDKIPGGQDCVFQF